MKDIISEKMKINSMKDLTKKTGWEEMEDPKFFYVPLSQHIGGIAKETVSKGNYVYQYQKIGEAEGKISGVIHSPVSGKVEDIIENPLPNGKIVKTIIIKNDFKYKKQENIQRRMEEVGRYRREEILEMIKGAGVVGEGRAQFPTHVKYDIGYKKIDTLIINGAECEPYLTADYVIMTSFMEELLSGIKIVEKLIRPREIVIGIEEGYSEVAEGIAELLKERRIFNIKVHLLPTAYPQGSELQLIKAVTGKEIKKGEIPSNHGIIVSNAGTVKSVYDAYTENKPLVERIVTISGEKVNQRGNFKIKVGTPLLHIMEKVKPEPNAKIVFGGPMMGEEVSDPTTPVIKGTSGILFLSNEIDSVKRENCIGCGYCVDVCPMGLMPMKFPELYRLEKYEKLKGVNLDSCIECGACEYVCPSRVPLIEGIKKGKEKLREMEGLK